VIVDAFQSPYVQSDLSIFNSTFGLPKASFQQIAPFGLTPFDPNDPNMDSWAEEITLAVLWAHAMAPREDPARTRAQQRRRGPDQHHQVRRRPRPG
jgi:subtilase family serine protease